MACPSQHNAECYFRFHWDWSPLVSRAMYGYCRAHYSLVTVEALSVNRVTRATNLLASHTSTASVKM
jgi:hypothetical protein